VVLQGQGVDIQIRITMAVVQVLQPVHLNLPEIITILPVIPPHPGVVVAAEAAEAVHPQGHSHVVAAIKDFPIQHKER
jgi:hypothetical protein